MAIREQDLGDRLAVIASQVSEPQFSIDSVARRIRQRRVRLVAMAGTTVLVLAAVAGLLSLNAGHGPVGRSMQPARTIWLPMKITVLGKTALIPASNPQPAFAVPAGRSVPIIAQVTVPRGVRVRTFRLGIVTTDGTSGGPDGPTGWATVLLRTTKVLTSGQHTFRLRWTVPRGLRPGTRDYLVAYWVAGQSGPQPIIASLVIQRP